MKMKNWMRSAGFTLVELIVVIAVLGILGAGAAVGYSGYVKKANKAADEALVAQVKYALEVAYVADPSHEQSAQVVLSTDAEPDVGGDAWTEAAMESAFGDNWTALRLQYNGWIDEGSRAENGSAIKNSSFGDPEAQARLLTQVGKLTGIVGQMMGENTDLVGSNFDAYLESIAGVTRADLASGDETARQKAANAVTLYVADRASAADPEFVKKVLYEDPAKAITDNRSFSVVSMIGSLMAPGEGNMGTAAALATMYAYAESLGNYYKSIGNEEPLQALESADLSAKKTVVENGVSKEVFDADQAIENVANAVNAMLIKINEQDTNLANLKKFFTEKDANGAAVAQKDINAYLAAMSAVSDSKDVFIPRLASSGCYDDGTAAKLLQVYVDGKVAVVADKNGATVFGMGQNS